MKVAVFPYSPPAVNISDIHLICLLFLYERHYILLHWALTTFFTYILTFLWYSDFCKNIFLCHIVYSMLLNKSYCSNLNLNTTATLISSYIIIGLHIHHPTIITLTHSTKPKQAPLCQNYMNHLIVAFRKIKKVALKKKHQQQQQERHQHQQIWFLFSTCF